RRRMPRPDHEGLVPGRGGQASGRGGAGNGPPLAHLAHGSRCTPSRCEGVLLTMRRILWQHHILISLRALPEKICSRSACGISSAFTAAMVLAISPRPCSEQNGASVAQRHFDVPKKAWPQRVAAASPLSAVSA